MNPYLVFVLVVLLGAYGLNLLAESLNLRAFSTRLPVEFEGCYDAGRYARSQQYLRENARLDMLSETVLTPLIMLFILSGGFNGVDRVARSFGWGPVVTGLLFAAMLLLAREVIELPFSAYHTFIIEEKYGFNRTTPGTFAVDILKGWLLAAIIGGPLFALVLWLFAKAGPLAWLYCWGAVTIFQLLLLYIAPVVILPLFNKFKPLEDGLLRQTITSCAASQGFRLKGIFTMDASKRSTKSNAFFIGFGRYKRIVLFDTLISKHSIDELMAILGHEMGHYKQRHIHKTLLLSILSTGLMLAVLSLFVGNRTLFDAFRMQETSVYAAVFFFGLMYTPLGMVLGIFSNKLSRHFEFAADAYAVKTCKRPAALISALKKLTVENLANLTPHRLKVFLKYSHPPILGRISAIRALSTGQENT